MQSFKFIQDMIHVFMEKLMGRISHTYLFLKNEMSISSFLRAPMDNDPLKELGECIKNILKSEKEITATNIWKQSQSPQVLCAYMDVLDKIDRQKIYKDQEKRAKKLGLNND